MAAAHDAQNILASLKDPSDIRSVPETELPALAQDIRELIIETVAQTGGHLAPSLGTVELTIALLRTFSPGVDKIIWDVGHQAYAYKILTGRAESFHTLRQMDGISGFPRLSESPYDHFGVGHSSTSISAGLGMAYARDLAGQNHQVVSIIGDGALTAGMAYEGLNQAGAYGKPFIVVLNDNQMSISKNVGALSYFLSRKMSLRWVRRVKREVEDLLTSLPGIGEEALGLIARSKKSFKTFFTPGILFEALHFSYIGPVNGHDIAELERAFGLAAGMEKPVLVHVLTQKGKGYLPAENNPSAFHGVGRFNPLTGKVDAPAPGHAVPSYTRVFASTLCELAARDPKIIGITAAMPEGTGLSEFAAKYPARFMDVGICEQHAVTLAAGLATQGFKPVVALYSTFLQRAYDQVVHDVALQNLPVVFAVDRAGLVGEDGATHQGIFDVAFLRHIPNMHILAPRDSLTLAAALSGAFALGAPAAVRYPRGECPFDIPALEHDAGERRLPEMGRGEFLREGEANGLCVIALGGLAANVMAAAESLEHKGGASVSVFDPVWIKPLPKDDLRRIFGQFSMVLIVEEHALQGGFGSAVLEFANDENLLEGCRILRHGLADSFVEHGKVSDVRKSLKLDVPGLVGVMQDALGNAL